jgi:hypothetical protein
MLFFWVLTPCRLVGRCQCFRETYCMKPWRWRQYVSLKQWCVPTSLHGVKCQKIISRFGLMCLSPTVSLTVEQYLRSDFGLSKSLKHGLWRSNDKLNSSFHMSVCQNCHSFARSSYLRIIKRLLFLVFRWNIHQGVQRKRGKYGMPSIRNW